jgi:polyisoprenoid-binding protein YceI
MSSIAELTPGTWTVDATHSSVGFVARHLMVTKVRGRFASFNGTVTVADDPLRSKVEATVDMASVTTGDAGRDGHLQNGDFFETDKYPTMKFVSTDIVAKGSEYVLKGDLTIKDVTKPVAFELEFDGVATDPWNNTKAGFSAETEINRKDFGLDWNVALDAGGVLVGEKVKIQLDVQVVKAA